jgi:ATP/maltotriose-dependent transcriptional regulator MalT
LAFAYSASGRFDDALGILHESEADARKRGDGHDLAQSLIAQSDVALTMGNYELARSLALEGRAAVQPYADPDSEMVAAINFATASLELGLVDDAERVATESLEVVHARADIPLQAACVQLLSGVAAERGDTEHAARLMGLLNRLHAEIDVGLGPAEQRLQDQIKARLATLDVAMLATATEAGRALSIDEVIAMGRTRAPS